ncbi:hypothetical protein FHN55_18955 [Streptomyces sp. NP160]|nr:hypothetical protein FHN55_18955 [Streptomyces sp. NP160]
MPESVGRLTPSLPVVLAMVPPVVTTTTSGGEVLVDTAESGLTRTMMAAGRVGACPWTSATSRT